jgi:hypothetical protein
MAGDGIGELADRMRSPVHPMTPRCAAQAAELVEELLDEDEEDDPLAPAVAGVLLPPSLLALPDSVGLASLLPACVPLWDPLCDAAVELLDAERESVR